MAIDLDQERVDKGVAYVHDEIDKLLARGRINNDKAHRHKALVTGAEAPKQQVAAAAAKAGNMSGSGSNIKIAPKADPKLGEFKWIVEANGAIRGWNEKNAIEISVTPKLEGGKVTWVCRGYPNASMPTSCGGRG